MSKCENNKWFRNYTSVAHSSYLLIGPIHKVKKQQCVARVESKLKAILGQITGVSMSGKVECPLF